MSGKLLFASPGCAAPRFKARGAKSALFTPPAQQNQDTSGRAVLETETARYARLRPGTCNPPSRLVEMFSRTARQNRFFFWKGGLFVFEPALEEANNRLLQSKQFYQLMNRDLLFATRLFCVIIRQQLARKRGAQRGES